MAARCCAHQSARLHYAHNLLVVWRHLQYTVLIYSSDDAGQDKPLADFIRDLKRRQPQLARLVAAGLRKLEHPQHHRVPLIEKVDPLHDLYELRVGGANIARVFFFYEDGQRVIATNGYVKKSQKLAVGELERARRCKQDWERRRHDQCH
jgi:hypothetical protein